jgi:adenylate kinase family enzyme
MSFISRHLQLNYKSDYLGSAGMITSPEIIGYLGTFTQESNLNRYSVTSIYVGQDTQSQLPIMVDMSEYRLSNEAVGNANGHIVVIGKSGSGKTFLTKSLMFQKALEKNLYVFDIENEYNDFSNEQSELYALILEKEKQNPNKNAGFNKNEKMDDIKRQRLYPNLSTIPHLSKEALIEKYVDYFDLMSTSRVINMFEIHYTDDQRKVINDNPSKFLEQSQVYQKHRSFLIDFIKDLINVTSINFDVEIGNCIDETYLDFYKNNHSGSIRGIDFNPNIYNPLVHMTQFPFFSDFKKVVEKRLNDLKVFEKNKASQNHHY